eukprot:14601136-Heterocapsa_arctica.AAC.1
MTATRDTTEPLALPLRPLGHISHFLQQSHDRLLEHARLVLSTPGARGLTAGECERASVRRAASHTVAVDLVVVRSAFRYGSKRKSKRPHFHCIDMPVS